MNRTAENKIFQIQQRIFWALSVAIAVLGILYVYFTAVSIVDVAERKRLESETARLRSEAVALEMNLIEKERSITKETAQLLGFVEAEARFASRGVPVARVSQGNDN